MGKIKEQLINHQNLLKEKGCYIEDLKLYKEDPIKWELLYNRLLGTVQEGRETARLISASPPVREFGECVFTVLTPDGYATAFSRGILLHMASMGSSIKWMLMNDYEEKVGINDGDIFFNNDPHIGGAHAADMAIFLPVFYEGELVAWVSGLSHTMEVGGTEPGGISPSALSRYDDGIMLPCTRVGANDDFFPDYHIMISRNTRDGKWWIYDDRAKLAGCIKMKKAVLSLIEEFGKDYFATSGLEMLESGRQFATSKLKSIFFPGQYKSCCIYDIPLSTQPIRMPIDWYMVAPLDVTVKNDGNLKIEYYGVSSAGPHSNNSSYPCLMGNHIYTILQDALYDGFFNNGLEESFDLIIPDGSILNPPIHSSCSVWATAGSVVASGMTQTIARAYFARGYREEGMSTKGLTAGLFAGGMDKNGEMFAAFNFELNMSGMGGQCSIDGLNASAAFWNPEVRMADIESFEHVWPLMWLGRGLYKDGGGYGKHSGGTGMESLYVVEDEPLHIESGNICSGDHASFSPGIFGGYPAACRYRQQLVNTNYKEVVENKMPLPHKTGDDPDNPDFAKLVKGELIRTPGQACSRQYQHHDLIEMFTGGGGGYGDVLERDVNNIEYDLQNELISTVTAQNVYKAVIDPKTNKIDAEKTRQARDKERQARIEKSIPVDDFVKAQNTKILNGEFSAIVKKTLNDCFKNSQKFTQEYIECWRLPDDFKGI